MNAVPAGVLHVVATPIGHLKDISLRALETLKSVDLVACEDTRHTAILLKEYGIHAQTVSYHSHSSPFKAERLSQTLKDGKNIALVSDAGLPGISDPGTALVQAALAASIPVNVVPGASASLMALVLSGFPTDRFIFEGFLPMKPGPRRKRLELLQGEERTAIVYESPHRVLKLLGEIETVLGNIPLSVSRELTKHFEETRRAPAGELKAHFTKQAPRGEFVVVIPPKRCRE